MSLLTKYRPRRFEDVVGHTKVVSSFKTALDKGSSKAFLFTGPSGVGKTTLARLAARYLKAEIVEVKAAVKTGIDDVRELIEDSQYAPFSGKKRVVLLEEVHALSKQAWQALLKEFEDAPAHLLWMLTTTEMNKVPAAVKTRCASYVLKPIAPEVLYELLERICEAEKLKVSDKILSVCAVYADGSPRQAIANLVTVEGVKKVEEAEELLEGAANSTQAIDLARALVTASWDNVANVLRGMEDSIDAESVRRVVVAYHAKMALIPGKGKHSLRLLAEMDVPFQQGVGRAGLIARCARIMQRSA